MPTVKAPTNKTQPQKKQTATQPQNPPKPMSSKKPMTEKKTPNAAVILFVIATLILLGLLGTFLSKSSKDSSLFTFKLAAPVLSELPEKSNSKKLKVKGTAPKNSTVTIITEEMSIETKADKEGVFTAIVELKEEDKKYEFTSKANKNVLFWKSESELSNVVSTTLDITAPTIKLVKLPTTIGNKDLTVKGGTTEATIITITVNGKETVIETGEENEFSTTVELEEGENKVVVTARDTAENETVATSTVTYTQGAITVGGASTAADGTLPESAGVLSDALNTLFKRYFGIAILVLGGLGYASSSAFVWLTKTYRN